MKQVRWAIATFLTLFATQYGIVAQQRSTDHSNKKQKREQIQEQKRNFLEKALALSEEESKQLMPILVELDEQRCKLWHSLREQRTRQQRGNELSEAENDALLESMLENRIKEAELERTYYRKCKGIIPSAKLVKLHQLNREFAKKFLHTRRHKYLKDKNIFPNKD